MIPETVLKKADKDYPVVVFIHGLGMSHRFWTSPDQETVFFGNAPLKIMVNPEPPEKKTKSFVIGYSKTPLVSPFEMIHSKGFSVLAYSQSRPAAKAEVLVDELHGLMQHYEELCREGVIFIAHSRGGIILRAYLQKYKPAYPVLAFFSIACPHRGSSLAKVGVNLSHLLRPLEPFFKDKSIKGRYRETIKRLFMFLSSEALKELLPNSEFINSLDDSSIKDIKTYCFAGKKPTLLIFYRWNKNCYKYNEMLRLPDFLTNVTPGLWPEEFMAGKGDGLVTVKSANFVNCRENFTYESNHAEIVYEKKFHEDLMKLIMEEI